MAKKHRFTATIEAGRGGGAWVEIPFDVKEAFGAARPKIKATFDGVPYRGSLAPMGGGVHALGILKAIRETLDKGVGDTVKVIVEADTEPRTVTVPEELRAELRKNPKAKARYEELSYTHRKEYASWVAEAKREETRLRRAAQAVEKILDS